ncbi:MAG: MTH938/NDUFAF3 family protein [Zoogloeaceae bacterium]|jgi:uncharacterized protein|nr:MTH938/NDUFAF3 family protein [Zoogloeaceae bacterium]
MRLQLDALPESQRFTRYGEGCVFWGEIRLATPVFVGASSLALDWRPPFTFSEWAAGEFLELAERAESVGAEILLIGVGNTQRFPRADWLSPFFARQIGVETMITRAACQTYNLLAGEGRAVAAALLLE